jgi:hypothetical protein
MRAKTESVPKSKVDIRNKFYEKMKNCIAQVSDEMVPLSNFVEGTNKNESKRNIVMFDSMIVKCKSRVMESYCMLGVELANLKFLYYVDFCANCSSSVDKYAVLLCKKCPHIASNVVGIREYFQYCESNLNKSSKSWINFLITVGMLYKQYPRLKRVAINVEELKRNISWLPIHMSKDVTFWEGNVEKSFDQIQHC